MKNIGVYVHIPFCISKCYYCDFNSFSNLESEFSLYTDKLCYEIENTKINETIDTIFIGGGTPSILPIKYLEKIIKSLMSKNISRDLEFTIEANPGTLSFEYLLELKKLGINRLSIGVQSLDDDLLKKIGRVHTKEEFLKSFYDARMAGFENINIDLMYNLPTQTISQWEKTLKEAVMLRPDHISAYSLIIEENTKIANQYDNGTYSYHSDEEFEQFNKSAYDILKEEGFNKYEVSNYSIIGKECKHNLKYWNMEDYYSFGLSSHSKILNKRFRTTDDLQTYCNDPLQKIDIEELTTIELIEESIMLGLRTTEGINLKKLETDYNEKFSANFHDKIDGFIKENYLITKGENISATNKGFNILNTIILELVNEVK